MNTSELLPILEAFFPVLFVGALFLLAIAGIKELFEETTVAFKKGIKA